MRRQKGQLLNDYFWVLTTKMPEIVNAKMPINSGFPRTVSNTRSGSTPTVSMEKTAKIRGFFVAKMADAVKNAVNGQLFRV